MIPPRRRDGAALTVLALSLVLAALIAAIFGSCGMPDDVRLSYGHEFRDDGSVGSDPAWDLNTGDSDHVGVSFGWRLKPMEVIPLAPSYPLPVMAPVTHEQVEALTAVSQFDALDWSTKIALVVCICWLGWVYRKELASLYGRVTGNGRVDSDR